MKTRNRFRITFPLFFAAMLAAGVPAAADSSHARIVRLSYVQGEVSYAHSASHDALADQKAAWGEASINLPLRQGDALATAGGRAEIEFENGATAYLNENTVLEFYDLSLNEGARVTRLVLRQGTAAFQVNAPAGDYFSVTGGDFTVEAGGRANFRLDNFDDGSTISVTKGVVSVVTQKETKRLMKGESLSLRAGNKVSAMVESLGTPDDFDRWVSARAERVARATNASAQYMNSLGYTAGFADLYDYGSWFMYPGYGYCWQPFNAGLGWSPFQYGGGWANFAGLGWTWVGSDPWGWLPYHFGGWMFAPGRGWLWAPSGLGMNGPIAWRPVTGVFVRSGNSVGIVPAHPLDARGKPPLNLGHGVIPTSGVSPRSSPRSTVQTAGNWEVIKKPARDLSSSTSAVMPAAPPARVSRSLVAVPGGTRVVGSNASITGEPRARAGQAGVPTATVSRPGGNAPPRVSAPPPRTFTPPPAAYGGATSSGGSRGGSSGRSSGTSSGASSSSGSRSSSGPSSSSSSGSSSAPRSAPSSAPSSSGRSH